MKNKTNKKIVVSLAHFCIMALLLILSACSKDSDNGTLPPTNEPTENVYVAGKVYKSNQEKAVYWKNTKEIELTKGVTDAEANDIFVVNNNVYVTGYEVNKVSQKRVATIWKNGEATQLKDNGLGSEGSFIKVENGNVYVAGRITESFTLPGGITGTRNKLVYWKNGGDPKPLPDLLVGTGSYDLNTFFVYNDKVYVAGYIYAPAPNTNLYIAKYWEDGVPVTVKDATASGVNCGASALFVDNTGVYVGFSEQKGVNQTGKYWNNKSNSEKELPFSYSSLLASLVVKDNNVFVQSYLKTYSKNGQKEIPLTNGSYQGDLTKFFIYKENVYVAGVRGPSALYFKNGVQTVLSPENFEQNGYIGITANSIFVTD